MLDILEDIKATATIPLEKFLGHLNLLSCLVTTLSSAFIDWGRSGCLSGSRNGDYSCYRGLGWLDNYGLGNS